ncbi:hypothetical protein [Brevundimonas sp. Root1423]|uniref:hypothetical protein n=1 Tax=Brevundimonas sp. Root1423 TaxID=1736462 RepID=UPI0006F32C9C|nr:hypothetical protein [Brevundimonas sp. Root1423]KQY85024.1 ammonium transporter family protein [Brevundimonas sp. Root1423]
MKVSTLLAAAGAIITLSAGAAVAAEACECCKDMAADSDKSCCDKMAAPQSPTPDAPPPAPTAPSPDAPEPAEP